MKESLDPYFLSRGILTGPLTNFLAKILYPILSLAIKFYGYPSGTTFKTDNISPVSSKSEPKGFLLFSLTAI